MWLKKHSVGWVRRNRAILLPQSNLDPKLNVSSTINKPGKFLHQLCSCTWMSWIEKGQNLHKVLKSNNDMWIFFFTANLDLFGIALLCPTTYWVEISKLGTMLLQWCRERYVHKVLSYKIYINHLLIDTILYIWLNFTSLLMVVIFVFSFPVSSLILLGQFYHFVYVQHIDEQFF